MHTMSSSSHKRKTDAMIVSISDDDANRDDDDDEENNCMFPTQLLWTRRWSKPWAALEELKEAGPPIDMQTLIETSKLLRFCDEKAVIVQKMYRGYLVRKQSSTA